MEEILPQKSTASLKMEKKIYLPFYNASSGKGIS